MNDEKTYPIREADARIIIDCIWFAHNESCASPQDRELAKKLRDYFDIEDIPQF